MQHITFVKKIAQNGKACGKCVQVEQHLRDSGYWNCVDTVLIADERVEDSTGVQLAANLGIDSAPFFVVKYDDGEIRVYTIYLKFVDEVLEQLEDQLPAYEMACA